MLSRRTLVRGTALAAALPVSMAAAGLDKHIEDYLNASKLVNEYAETGGSYTDPDYIEEHGKIFNTALEDEQRAMMQICAHPVKNMAEVRKKVRFIMEYQRSFCLEAKYVDAMIGSFV